MNFGLDYDGTFNAAPELWREFVLAARRAGHEVYVVTMRYPSETVAPFSMPGTDGMLVLATSRMAKEPFCKTRGLDIHVWIDDNPKAVHMDASEIWPNHLPEGQEPPTVRISVSYTVAE